MFDLLSAVGAPGAMPGEATPFDVVARATAAVCRKVTRTLALLVSLFLLVGAGAAVAQGAPTMTAISPNSGALFGANIVTITGTDLDTTTAVTFGGISASFTINGATSLSVTVPSAATDPDTGHPATGFVDVAVTTPAGVATVPNGYRYVVVRAANITFPIGGSTTYSQHITVTGTADPGNTLFLNVSDSGNNSVFTAGASVDVNGNWQVALPPLPVGTYTLFAAPQTHSEASSPGSNFPVFTVASGAPPAIAIDPITLADAVTDRPYRSDLTASGGTPPLGFAISAGALPTGLSLSPGGSIAGTPRVGGTFTFTVTATDIYSDGGPYSGSGNYTLTVAAPTVLLTPATLPDGAVTAAYSQTIAASGATAPYAFSLSAGTLPPGLALSAAGLLSGTATTAGTFAFTVAASDSSDGSSPYIGYRAFSVRIAPPIVGIGPLSLPGATRGLAYAAGFNAGGGTAPYRFTLDTGALPPGVTLAANGALSGTPTTAGTYTFSVVATDASPYPGPYAASRTFGIVVGVPTVSITPTILSGFKAGVFHSATLRASGGAAPYSYAVTAGPLPAGLSMTSDGVISGTPTAKGNFAVTITATDSFGNTGARAYSITVAAPSIVVTGLAPTGAQVGVFYSASYSALGGTAPYSYSLFTGTPQHGLTLSSNGILSGTPTAGGSTAFIVQASDSTTGGSATTSRITQNFVVADPTLVFATIPGGTQLVPYAAQVNVTGGTAPYSFSLMAGALPPGLVLGPHGALSGTPTVAGRFTFSLMAVDNSTGSGPYTGSQTFNIDIAAAPDAPLIATPAGGATVTTATPVYSGMSTAAVGSIVTVTVDSATPLTTAVDGGGAWTVTQPTALAEGGHGVSATVQVGGVSSAPSTTTSFTVASRPTVTAVSPTGGPAAGGVAVTITGTALSGAIAVKFGTITAPFTIVSATEIDTTAPAGSGTVDITVTTPSGTSATAPADQFSYVASVAIGRSWVSRSGLDTNPCTRAAPCLTFQAALALTAPGGELNCLDRTGYGQATITQSVSIVCARAGASVTVAAGNGIVIAAGPTDIVTLSGLDISGGATAGNGILVQSVGTLRIENSRLRGFTATGANAMLVAPTVGTTKIFLAGTSVVDNLSGLMVSPASGASVAVAIRDATFQNNSVTGVRLDTVGKTNAMIQASIDRSLFSGNYVAILAKSPLGTGSAQLTVTNTALSRNTYAISLNGPLVATIGLDTIVNNGTGVSLLGGSSVASLGGNRIGGNTTDGAIALTYRNR